MLVVRPENLLGCLRRRDHNSTQAAEVHQHHRAVAPRDRLEVPVRPAAKLEEVAQHRELLRGPRRTGSIFCSLCSALTTLAAPEEQVERKEKD